MQRFEQLQLEDGTTLTDSRPIEKWLYTSPFYWILECEVDNVKLKIKDGILHWQSGILYWGDWKWGVFESGEFRSGKWNGGIWLNGTFKGKWMNGVFKGGTFSGEKIAGEFPNEKIT
jgi:hypothetical protein